MQIDKGQNLNILDIANSDLVNALSNIAQFYNIYQSTKAGTYAQLNHDLHLQTSTIENQLDAQTNSILEKTLDAIKRTEEQNRIIISQNDKILDILNEISGVLNDYKFR